MNCKALTQKTAIIILLTLILSTCLVMGVATALASSDASMPPAQSSPGMEQAVAAKVWTDKTDYQPGELVTIYGSGFTAKTPVALTVTKQKDNTTTNWSTISDTSGNFTTTYQIDPKGAPLYTINATDGVNNVGYAFTDSSYTLSVTDDETSQTATAGNTLTVHTGDHLSISATSTDPLGYGLYFETDPISDDYDTIIAFTTVPWSGSYTIPTSISAGNYQVDMWTENVYICGVYLTVLSSSSVSSFTVSAPASATAGSPFSVTVTAKDSGGSTFTGYTGTIRFTSSDSAAVLPSDYTFQASDNGVKTFTSGVTLKTTGSKAVTVTDTSSGSVTGTSSGITVGPSSIDHFTITGYPTTTTSGQSFGSNNLVVTAYDQYNNVKTDYTGQVFFTSTDGSATLPYTFASRYTFTGGDAGTHTFAGTGFTLNTVGSKTISVTGEFKTATSNAITVNAASTITLTPNSGYVGDTVAVTGSGFGSSQSFTVTYGTTTVASGTTTSTGTIPTGTTFTVPASTAGSHTVTVTQGSNSATAAFTVTAKITLTPNSGPSGTVVTVIGTGYDSTSTIALRHGAGWPTTPSTVTTDSSGSFSCSFTTISGLSGDEIFKVEQGANSASATFSVIASITLVSPSSGNSGTTIAVIGDGFHLSRTFTLYLGGVAQTTTTSITDDMGEVRCSFSVPSNFAAGSYTIQVKESEGYSVTATFNVIPKIQVTINANVGDTALLFGHGFLASHSGCTATFDGNPITLSASTTDANGYLFATFTVPASTSGSKTVVLSDGTYTASATLTVNPKITLSPSSGIVGSSVTVSGTGFDSSSTVTIKYDTVTQTTTPGTITTSTAGAFSCSFTVPTSSTGAHTVEATQGSNSASATYTVTNFPTITFATGGMNNDASGTILTIDGSTYTYAQISAGLSFTTWTTGSTHTITATSTISVSGVTKQYVFNSWTNGNGLTTASGTFTTPSSDTTVTVNYKAQYQVTPYYAVSGGGSPTIAGAVHYTSNGVSQTVTPASGSSGGSAVWADSGTAITYTSPIAGASGERWIIDNPDTATEYHTVLASVTSSQTVTATYYHQYRYTVNYAVSGGGTPSAPLFTAPSCNGPSYVNSYLSNTASTFWINAGGTWSLTNPLSATATERWAISPSTGTVTEAVTATYTYYHQYPQTLSYQANYGSPSAPTASGKQFGSTYQQTLTTSAATYWFDAVGTIDISTVTSEGQRWIPANTASSASSFSAASGHTYTILMIQQCLVTFTATGGNILSDGSGTILTVDGVAKTRADLPFTTWLAGGDTQTWAYSAPVTGSSGNYFWYTTSGLGQSGQSGILTVNGSGTVTATYTANPPVTFTASGLSSDASGTVLIIDGTSYTYSQLAAGVSFTDWTVGSIHNIEAAANVGVSGGTKQYTFTSWTNGNGLTTASGTFTTPSSNTAVTVSYKTQYKVSFQVSNWDTDIGTANILTVGATHYQFSQLPTNMWIDAGTAFEWVEGAVYDGATKLVFLDDSDGVGINSPITAGGTNTVTYETLYKVTLYYTVNSGSPTVTDVVHYVCMGESLTATPTLYWAGGTVIYVDPDSAITYDSPIGATATERWQIGDGDSTTHTVVASASAGGDITVTYYHQYLITFAYTTQDSSNIEEGSLIGLYNSFGNAVCIYSGATYGACSPATAFVDAGAGNVCYITYTSGTQRWIQLASPALFDVSSSATIASPTFYHQYLQTLSYQISGGGSPDAPTVYYTKGASATTNTAALDTSVSDWMDSGTDIKYSNPLGVSGSGERWQTGLAISDGKSTVSSSVSSAATLNPTYYHQYHVSIATSVHNPPTEKIESGLVVCKVYQFGSLIDLAMDESGYVNPTSLYVDAGDAKVLYVTATSASGNDRWEPLSDSKDVLTPYQTCYCDYVHERKVTFGYSTNDLTSIPAGIKIGLYELGSGFGDIYTTAGGGVTPTSGFVNIDGTVEYYLTAIASSGTERWTLSSFDPIIVLASSTSAIETDYLHQVKVNAVLDWVGTKFYNYPTFTSKQYGLDTTLTVTDTASGDWFDVGAAWSIDDHLTTSYTTQRWQLGQSATGTIPATPTTLTFTYYHQLKAALSYSISGTSTGAVAPTLSYYAFGASASATLTGSNEDYWLDYNTAWSVTNPLGGSSGTQRWQTGQTTSGTITAGIAIQFIYNHQYPVTPYYTVSDSSTPTVTDTLSFTQFGATAHGTPTLGSSGATPIWVDEGGSVSYTSPITSGAERWMNQNSDAGTVTVLSTVTSATSATFAYYHQYSYQLAYQVSGGGNPSDPTLTAKAFGSTYAPTLTTSLVTYWFDAGQTGTLSTIGDSQERWAPPITSAECNAFSPVTAGGSLTIPYYHQYSYTVKYAVSGGGTPTNGPMFTSTSLSDPLSNRLSTSDSTFWVNAGASWTVSTILDGSTSTERWTTSQTTTGIASAAATATYTYNHQYKVSFQLSGLDSDAGTNTVLTVGSTDYKQSDFPIIDLWVDSGATYSWQSTVNAGTGKRFSFTSATGPSSPISAAGTVTGIYHTEYQVTFTAASATDSNLPSDGSGTIVTVGGAAKNAAALPFAAWYDSGASVTWAYTYTVTSSSDAASTRYSWKSTSGLDIPSYRSGTLTVSSSGTITAVYQKQYQISFYASGLGGDANSRVLSIKEMTSTSNYYPAAMPLVGRFTDSNATITWSTTVSGGTNKQYTFKNDDSGITYPPSGPGSVTATYTTQYKVSFLASGGDSDVGTANVLTVGSTQYQWSQLPLDLWVDAGTTFAWKNTPVFSSPTKYITYHAESGLSSPISTSGSSTATFSTYYLVTPYFTVNGGGNPTVTVHYTQDGTAKTATATQGSTDGIGFYVDAGSAITYDSPIVGGSANERWQIASGDTATHTVVASASAGGDITVAYYHQYYITFGYWDNDDFPIPSGTQFGTYTVFGSSQNINSAGTFNSPLDAFGHFYGAASSASAWVDAGADKITYQTVTLSSQRWAMSASLTDSIDVSGDTYDSTTGLNLIIEYGYYYQVKFDINYDVIGGGLPNAPTLNAIQWGYDYTPTLSTASTSYWLDYNEAWSITNPLAGSTSTERYYSTQTLSGTATAAATLTPTYYHQYLRTLSYQAVNGESVPTAPVLTARQKGAAYTATLSTTATSHWLDAGTAWSVTNPLDGASATKRWMCQETLTGTVTESVTATYKYYSQYLQTLSYQVVSDAPPSTPVVEYGFQFGSTYEPALTTTPTGYWFDYGLDELHLKTIDGAANERWYSKNWIWCDNVGTQVFSVYHQYQIIRAYTTQDLSMIPYSQAIGAFYHCGESYTTWGGHTYGETYSLLYWIDAGSKITFNTYTPADGKERYIPTQTSFDASSGGTITVTYYHQYMANFGYGVSDLLTITSGTQIGTYTAFGDSTNRINAGLLFGSTSPASAWVDAGVGKITYTTATVGSTRWSPADGPIRMTVDASGTYATNRYYHQYKFTLNYATSDGSTPATAPTLTSTKYGSDYTATLTTTATEYWLDINAAWSITNPLAGSTSTERYYSTQTLSGTATGTATLSPTYYHQYSVAFSYGDYGLSSPDMLGRTIGAYTQFGSTKTLTTGASAGVISPASDWVDAGTSVTFNSPITITADVERFIIAPTDTGTHIVITSVDAAHNVAAAAYYGQFKVSFAYTTNDASTIKSQSQVLIYTKFGAATYIDTDSSGVLATTSDWADSNTAVDCNSDIWLSATERYSNAYGTFVIDYVSALERTANPYYYHQVEVSFNWHTSSTVPTYPSVDFYQYDILMTGPVTGSSSAFVDIGSTYTYTTTMYITSTERITTTEDTGTVYATTTSLNPLYYHQYSVVAGYSTSGGSTDIDGHTMPNPTVYYKQCGSDQTATALSSGAPTVWVDAGTSIQYTNPIGSAHPPERWLTSGSIVDGKSVIDASVDASGTLNPTYYRQWMLKIKVTFTGGAAGCSSIPLTGTFLGVTGTLDTLTNDGVSHNVWADTGTTLTLPESSTANNGERWAHSEPYTFDVEHSVLEYLTWEYHQYAYQLSYNIADSSSQTAPTLTGTQTGSPYIIALTNTATTYWLDADSAWSVTNPLTGSTVTERYYSSSTLSGTVTATATLSPTYYHQYLQTLSYQLIGGGIPTSGPIVSGGKQFGVSYTPSLTATATGYWFDAKNDELTISTPVAGAPGEQWAINEDVDSTKTNTKIIPLYHQYQVTFAYTTHDGSTITAPIIGHFKCMGSQLILFSRASYGQVSPQYGIHWVDAGTGSVSFSTADYVVERWVLSTSPHTFDVTAPCTITESGYTHQFQVDFDASANVLSDGVGVVVTVNSADKTRTDLPFSAWYDVGSTVTYAYQNNIASPTDPARNNYAYISTDGLGQTTRTGTYTVTAPGTITATYTLQTATSIAVSATTPATAGSATTLTVTIKDAAGATMTQYTGTVHFTSTDSQAVLPADYTFQLSDSGTKTFTVTLKTAGSKSIIATDTTVNTITGSASVTVNPASLASIAVSVTSNSVVAGTQVSFYNTGYDQYGNTLGSQSVTYTVNGAIVPGASVTKTATGTYTVSVTTSGVTKTPASFTVTAGPLTRIDVQVSQPIVDAGSTVNFYTQGSDQYGNSLGPQAVTFTVNGTAITGSSVTETVPGTYIVSLTGTTVTVTPASFHVNAGALASLVVTVSSANVSAGTPVTLSATGFDRNNNSLGLQTVTFTVNGSPIVGNTVNETLPGDYVVSVTGSGVSVTDASFHVNHADADHITVASSLNSITAGGNAEYTVMAVDQYGNSWDVMSNAVLSIDCPAGSYYWVGNSVTVTKAGQWAVTASYAGITGTNPLTVTHADANTLTVTPTTTTTAAGQPVTFTATAQDIYGNSWTITTQTAWNANASAGGSWSSNTYTNTKAGNYTITGTYAAKSASATLTITPAQLDHFTITSPASAGQGTAFSITVTAYDAYNNTITNYTGTVSLGASSGSIAPSTAGSFVNGSWTGTVTLSSAGSQTITVSGNGKTGTSQTITVNPAATPTPTPTPTPTTTTPSTTSPTTEPTITPTPTPTPTTTPTDNTTSTTIIATQTTTQQTYNVTVNGNINAQQMSNMTITPHQENGTTVVAFSITGEAGTTGYANITIAKSAIPYGTIPKLYIDGVEATEQGYTEDADNYYLWFTTHFSTHQVTIQFANAQAQILLPWLTIILVAVAVLIALLVAIVVLRRRRK